MCLQQDHYEGLSSLITYCKNNQVEIAQWPIHKFRSSVNFYLNESFALKPLLTFCGFYVQHATSLLS